MRRTARPIRVLHVINGLGTGGTQHLLLRLLAQLPQAGAVASGLCVLGRLDGDLPEDLDLLHASGLAYSGDYRDVVETLRTARRLRARAQAFRADIVHTYLWTSDLVGGLAVGRGPIRHLCHIVDRRTMQVSSRPTDRAKRWATRRVLRQSNARFVAVSEAARDYAHAGFGWPLEHVRVALNGIDVDSFAPSDQGGREHASREGLSRPVVLGIIGRLVEEKGHTHLLGAAARLVEQGRDVVVRIAGEGELLGALQQQARDQGIADRTHFLGRVEDARAFYESVDVFVQPSIHSEGLPTTILEAMAAERPVVATDVGGAAEAVEQERTGYVVPASDAGALAADLERLVLDAEARARLGRAGRKRVEASFTSRSMASAVVDAYTALLEGW